MILLKGLAGAIIAVIAMWAAILYVYTQRLNVEAKRRGITGLGAVAGEWTFLLQKPSVMLLLTVAFGVGLYVTTRLSK